MRRAPTAGSGTPPTSAASCWALARFIHTKFSVHHLAASHEGRLKLLKVVDKRLLMTISRMSIISIISIISYIV